MRAVEGRWLRQLLDHQLLISKCHQFERRLRPPFVFEFRVRKTNADPDGAFNAQRLHHLTGDRDTDRWRTCAAVVIAAVRHYPVRAQLHFVRANSQADCRGKVCHWVGRCIGLDRSRGRSRQAFATAGVARPATSISVCCDLRYRSSPRDQVSPARCTPRSA